MNENVTNIFPNLPDDERGKKRFARKQSVNPVARVAGNVLMLAVVALLVSGIVALTVKVIQWGFGG